MRFDPLGMFRKGDAAGHDFRGNQYATGEGGREFRPGDTVKYSKPQGEAEARLRFKVLESHAASGQRAGAPARVHAEALNSGMAIHPVEALHPEHFVHADAKKSDAGDMEKGDAAGHEFRGNQYKDGQSGEAAAGAAAEAMRGGNLVDSRALGSRDSGHYAVGTRSTEQAQRAGAFARSHLRTLGFRQTGERTGSKSGHRTEHSHPSGMTATVRSPAGTNAGGGGTQVSITVRPPAAPARKFDPTGGMAK